MTATDFETDFIKKTLGILHLEDNPRDAQLVRALLEADGLACNIKRVQTRAEFERALDEGDFDLIISDFALPSFNGLSALQMARQRYSDKPFILLSGTLGEEQAVESLKAGATDYLLKDRSERLAAAVRRSLREARDRAQRLQAEQEAARLAREVEQQRNRLNSIINTVPGIVWEAWGDPDSTTQRIDFVSEYIESLLGYGVEEWLSSPNFWLRIVHPDDKERAAREAAAIYQSRKGGTAQFRWIAKDGRVVWVKAESVVLLSETGAAIGMRGVTMDITRQKQMEEQLMQSEKRYRELFEGNPHPMWVYDLETLAFLAVNDAAIYHYGYSREEFLNMTLREIRPAKDIDRLMNDISSSPQTFNRGVWKHRKKDGTIIDVEISSHQLLSEARPARLVLANDITEQKRAQERIEEQAALLEKANDAIFVCDLDGCITYWNKAAQRIYGWSEAEAVGKTVNELLQDNSSQIKAAREEFFEKGEWLGELSNRTKEGKVAVVQSRWTLLRDKKGQPKSRLVISTDITEKKQSEAKFLRMQRMENIGALAGGIAHDLNNCLAPILMATDMLRDELTSEDGLQMLETMSNSAQRGADMVRQILSFSRGVSGDHVVLQLKHLISDMEKFAQGTFPQSIRIQTMVKSELFPILGDATQLHQILLNLFVNARDAMPQGGILRVEAENINVDETFSRRQSAGPHVVLTVTDTGHGMSPEVLEKIFEPFFTTKELGKGTGLGLSTVMAIAKTHHGFVDVSSEVGKGTSFRIFLPVASGEVQSATQKRPAPPIGTGELILIVDDEKAILEMTKLMLEAYNYRVLTAEDGVEAIMQFQEHQNEIRAVVTDMMMPNMNGPELMKKLRQIAPEMKIIGVSGLGSEAALNKAGSEFAQTILTKPFSPELLLIRLHETLTAR